MAYLIQTRRAGGAWTTDGLGHPVDNRFANQADACMAIVELRALGSEWATAQYRVVLEEDLDEGVVAR